MPTPPLSDELCREAVDAFRRHNGVKHLAWKELKLDDATFANRLKRAAERGMMLDHPAAMPGFRIAKVSTDPNGGQTVTQKPEIGPAFVMPSTHHLGKMTVQRDADGRVVQDWIRVTPDQVAREAAMREAIDALKEEIPRAEPVSTHLIGPADRLNQYTVTDLHFGQLSWREETGADYDLKIAEKLLIDWFTYAIKHAPDAHTGLLAQLGDLLHFDSLQAVTPAHGHILDADSRFAKVVRVVIRTLKRIIRMMLEKHEHVHIIMADANHDPASEIWLREMFAAFYEDEPRLTVDTSASSYNAYEWGLVSLFYHHGHKRKVKDVDRVWIARNREMFGRTKFSYGHTGHLHSDEVFSALSGVKVERHETLAAPSSYEANGGWTSGRSSKVITYSKKYGEVGRSTITPEMVAVHEPGGC
jgi:hypothetical protein